MHPDAFAHRARVHTHKGWQRMMRITIRVVFKSLKKLAERLTQYLFIGAVCVPKWMNEAKKPFKPAQNDRQQAGPNSSAFLGSSCLSGEGCRNPRLNLLLISAHKNPFIEMLLKGGVSHILHFTSYSSHPQFAPLAKCKWNRLKNQLSSAAF